MKSFVIAVFFRTGPDRGKHRFNQVVMGASKAATAFQGYKQIGAIEVIAQ
jgi:hypothetical protein